MKRVVRIFAQVALWIILIAACWTLEIGTLVGAPGAVSSRS